MIRDISPNPTSVDEVYAAMQQHSARLVHEGRVHTPVHTGIGEVVLYNPFRTELAEIPYWPLQQFRFGDETPFTTDCKHYEDPYLFRKLVTFEVERSHIPTDQARMELENRGKSEPNEIVLTHAGIALAIHHNHIRFKTSGGDPVEVVLQPPVTTLVADNIQPTELWEDYQLAVDELLATMTPQTSRLRNMLQLAMGSRNKA